VILACLLLVTAGCRHRKDPQATFEQARLTLRQGNLASAVAMAEDALKQYPSDDSEWHWRFTWIKAQALIQEGKYNEALALVSAEPPAKFRDSDFAIRRKLVQALSFANTQRLNEAVEAVSQAGGIAESKHPELNGEVALRRGTVCFIANDLGCAESGYRAAMQSAREQHDLYSEASALTGLAIVSTRLGHYDEAVEWNRAALEVAQAAGARSSQGLILGNTAWCYRKLGDYENALALSKQAEELARQTGSVADQIFWLAAISNTYSQQGDSEHAKEYLLQGLNLARAQDDKGILLQYLNALASIALDDGDINGAKKYYQEAKGLTQGDTDVAALGDLALVHAQIQQEERDFAGAKKSFRAILEDKRSEAPQKWGAEAKLAQIYTQEGATTDAEREYRHLLDTIEGVRSSVGAEELRLSFLASVISFYNDYVNFLVARKQPQEALRVAELSRARTLAEGLGRADSVSLSAANFRPQKTAQRLHSILLFYWVGPEHSYVWVIAPEKTTCVPLLKQSDIDPALQSYRKAIVGGADVLGSGDANGKKLYEVLVAPVQKLIPGNSRVIIVPSDNLYALNFETLIVPNPEPHYWIEDVTVSTAGSLTLLAAANQRADVGRRSLLLVGNTESPNKEFPRLPQSEVEMQKVSSHFDAGQRKVLEGKQATPSAYLGSAPQEFAYLHFVTHGTASLTRPLESAVILSREGDTYKLYARDIVQHPLKAELVTISACNAAGTRAYAGEGLVGLSWAFLRAGAHNVIASLWEVSDASSTGQLMDKLYQGLDQSEDPAVALRNAKLFILHANAGTVFRKPFYWAPFQLYAGS